MNRHKNNTRKVRRLVTMAVVASVALTIMVADRLDAQRRPPQRTKAEAKSVAQIGTYDPQKAFEQYPDREKLMEMYQSVLPALQEAQKEGNQRKAQELQQKLSQKRDEIIKNFEEDVRETLPDIAKAANVQIIALDIIYAEEGVNQKDVTPQIVKAITEEE